MFFELKNFYQSIFDIGEKGLAHCPWPITVRDTVRLEGFLNKFQSHHYNICEQISNR